MPRTKRRVVYTDKWLKFFLIGKYLYYILNLLSNLSWTHSEQGLAKPYADKLITLILAEDDYTADKPKLQTAYYYLTYYNFIKHNYKDAIGYADKVLELHPGHPQAEKIKEISKKYAI